MPGVAIGKKLNYGYPGTISRSIDAVVENKLSTGEIDFGTPVVLNSDNTVSAFGASDTAADFVGIAVREVKQAISVDTSTSGYLDKERTDILTRGYMSIKVNAGTPTPNGKVYIRIVGNVAIPAGVIGGFEAAPDTTNTVELSGVRFTTGEVDANGVAEITILNRVI